MSTIFAIMLIVLVLIMFKSGVTGCLTFVLSSVLIIIAGSLLFDNGFVYGILLSVVLAVYQIFKRKAI